MHTLHIHIRICLEFGVGEGFTVRLHCASDYNRSIDCACVRACVHTSYVSKGRWGDVPFPLAHIYMRAICDGSSHDQGSFIKARSAQNVHDGAPKSDKANQCLLLFCWRFSASFFSVSSLVSLLLSSHFYFSFLPKRNSGSGSLSRLFPPPPHYGTQLHLHLVARRLQPFLPSPTRIELRFSVALVVWLGQRTVCQAVR